MLHAVGIALAAKIRKTGQVAMTSMGEGSSNQGDVHEGLNFAAIHKLPFILCIENNGYAISVPVSKQLAVPDVATRAAGYGIPGVIVDGADVLACYRAAKEAVDRARRGDGPTLIEAKVIRLTAHSSDDQQTKYRSAEELAALQQQDPLPRFRGELRDAGVLTEELEASIAAEVEGRDRRGHGLRRERRRPEPGDGDEVGLCRGLAGETPPAWGFGGEPRAGGPRGRHVRPRKARATDGAQDLHRGRSARRMSEEMRRDESVILLGEDVGLKGGVFLATDGLFAEFGEDRVIDTPLTESHDHRRLDRRGDERPPARSRRSSSPTSSTRRSTSS